LENAAWQISFIRNHNAAAKVSHRKKTIKELRKRGFTISRMRTCVGSNFAL